jgi:hypothetical protein
MLSRAALLPAGGTLVRALAISFVAPYIVSASSVIVKPFLTEKFELLSAIVVVVAVA